MIAASEKAKLDGRFTDKPDAVLGQMFVVLALEIVKTTQWEGNRDASLKALDEDWTWATRTRQ